MNYFLDNSKNPTTFREKSLKLTAQNECEIEFPEDLPGNKFDKNSLCLHRADGKDDPFSCHVRF